MLQVVGVEGRPIELEVEDGALRALLLVTRDFQVLVQEVHHWLLLGLRKLLESSNVLLHVLIIL
jgi:hypothetical protein